MEPFPRGQLDGSLRLGFGFCEGPIDKVPPHIDESSTLRNLRVDCIQKSEEVIALGKLLAFHSPSLKRLSLRGVQEPQIMSLMNGTLMEVFPLPYGVFLEKLEALGLWNTKFFTSNFLYSCPNLRRLELNGVNPTFEFCEGPESNWVLPFCTELNIGQGHFTAEPLRVLFRKLPNLEELTLYGCNNEVFRVICELLPKLEYLHLTYGLRVDDLGISGLDEEDVARINEEGEDGHWWPITAARVNISALTKLKWLKMFIPMGKTRPGYTSAVCIRKLPQLRYVDIGTTTLRPEPIYDRLNYDFKWRDGPGQNDLDHFP